MSRRTRLPAQWTIKATIRTIPTVIVLLIFVVLQLTACSGVPESSTDPSQGTAAPETLVVYRPALEDTVPDLPPDWPVAPHGQATPADWENLYEEALASAAEGRPDRAQDLLFTLQELTSGEEPADADSLYLQHRRSLQRRLVLLGGLLAEQTAYQGDPALADSVLTAEYLGLQGFGFPDSLVPATGTHLPPLHADLLKIEHGKVDRWVEYFTGRGRRHFQIWLDRQGAVDSLITTILVEEGLPEELIYLAMIESGLSTRARSNVGAVGPWQFMPGTGRAHGLTIDWWMDERRDLVKSTHAACSYLGQLYREFGDWALVLAAYNWGEGRVRRQLRVNGHDNFWDYRMPRQTVEYIPKFIAAARIGTDPTAYGFTVSDPVPMSFEYLKVQDATDLALVAQCAKVDKDKVASLNPALLRRATPPGAKNYPVRVPEGTATQAERALRKIPADKRLTWRKHQVQRGETLSHIASRWGTTVKGIQESNGMGRDTMIRPGDQLLIPMPGDLSAQARARAEKAGRYIPPKGYERVTYTIRSGDTLGRIAQRLGVSVKHLKKVNGIKDTSKIYPGKTLAAYRPPSKTG